MADIDVVKARNGSKVWLWVLLVIVALLVIWFMTAGNTQAASGSRLDGGQPYPAAPHWPRLGTNREGREGSTKW